MSLLDASNRLPDRNRRSCLWQTAALPLLIAGLVSFLVGSCGGDQEQDAVAERVVSVKTIIVEPTEEELVKTYTGSLEGKRQTVVYSKISEAVKEVHVQEGQQVREDEVLISLDRSGPSSSYQQSYSLFKNAEKNYNKMAYLYEEGAVSESDYDAAKTDYEVSKAAFEAAKQLVEIQSPISGTVTSIKVSQGDFLSPGQVLSTVAQIDTLRVKFGVNAADVDLVSEGDVVRITSERGADTALGVIATVAKSADPDTRAYQVEAKVPNPAGRLTPGMFVRVSLIMDRLTDAIIVPRKAVLSLDEDHVAYVIEDGLAQRRVVTLGVDFDGRVEILDGLSVGDTLVTVGQNYLDDGVKVNITSTE